MKTDARVKTIEKIENRLSQLIEGLSEIDNNRAYILRLYAIRNLLQKYANFLTADESANRPDYQAYFTTGIGFTFEQRIYFSIEDYKNGVKPF